MLPSAEDLPLWAWIALTVLNYAIILVLVPRIVFERRDSRATLAWLFFIILVPYLALIAFWVLGATGLRLRRWERRSRRAQFPELAPLATPCEASPAGDDFPGDAGLLRLARELDASEATSCNAVELYREGARAFDAIEQAIDGARDHVHLIYYIWEPDGVGTRMRDALVRARRRDVTVRLIVDDVGSYAATARFFAPLVAAGGRVERFLPVSLLARHLSINHRNHRKVVVVDGQIGFTGGMNVGDAYVGIPTPWRDAHVRVEGPAVLRLQEIFGEDWFRTTGESLADERWFPPTERRGAEWAQFVSSGPDERRWQAIHVLFFALINQARRRVWLESPYFVPDAAILMALQAAALRGVDVRLLLPGKIDHPLVRYAARSFYDRLLAAGVRIFEVPRALLHAKTMTIDGCYASVGSSNMDLRSFHLNFEANGFFYGPLALALEVSFTQLLDEEAVEITREEFAGRGRVQRWLEASARVLAPIL